jgi:hypothetical protein
MTTMFVAVSKGLQAWGNDVGLTKHLYKLGLSPLAGAATIDAMNSERHGGRDDWVLLAETDTVVAEDDALGRLGRKETLVDPRYYPQIKGASGIVKVKLANVENHFVIESALAGRQRTAKRVSPGEIATYLIRKAGG